MPYKDDTESKLNARRIKELITPSWLSGLLAISAGLLVTVGVILAFSFNNSSVQQQLINYETTSPSQTALTLPGQAPPGSNSNSLQNTWPLLAFWGMVGLVAYFAIEQVIKMISNAEAFSKELNYVHARRNMIIKTTVEFLLLRIVSAILWLSFIDLFFKRIIPYSIVAAHASASDFFSIGGLVDAFLAFSMIALSIHLHTIFLRLTLRRARVFSNADYLDV